MKISWKYHSYGKYKYCQMKTYLLIRYENRHILKFIKQKFESILRLTMKNLINSQLSSLMTT